MDSALLTMILSSSPYFNCDKFEGTYWTRSQRLLLEGNERIARISAFLGS
jgi:hypothetical protein